MEHSELMYDQSSVLIALGLLVAVRSSSCTTPSGHRPTLATLAMLVLVIAVVFIIIDLDRPKRGLIRVSQERMHDVAALLGRDAAPAAP